MVTPDRQPTSTRRSAAARFATDWQHFILAIRRARAGGAEDDHLSLSQWGLLRALAETPELPSGKLAAAAGIAPATATGVLDGLERAGIVERRRPAHDRRTVTIRLTPDGAARLERKHRRIAEQGQLVFRALAPDEREQAGRLLRHLAQVIEQL